MNSSQPKVLHILKSEPDETIQRLTDCLSMDNAASVVMLYQRPADWPALVDKIFENDKVICWW
jgi:hypothetical protein